MSFNKSFLSSIPLNNSFESAPQAIADMKLYAIQARFTGSTCSFSAKIQVSADSPFVPGGPTVWDDLLDSSLTFTEAGTQTWDVEAAGYVWVKLVITDHSSGANNGTISARINAKGPGI